MKKENNDNIGNENIISDLIDIRLEKTNENNYNALDVIRSLGNSEKYQLSKVFAGIYGAMQGLYVVKVTDKKYAPISEKYCQKICYHSMNKMVHLFPQLSYAIVDIYSNNPKFVGVKPFDFKKVFRVTRAHNIHANGFIDTITAQDMRQEFGFSKEGMGLPHWRIHAVLSEKHPDEMFISITVDHTIMDGLSFVTVCETFFKTVNESSFYLIPDDSLTSDSIITPPEMFEPTPVLEDFISHKYEPSTSITNTPYWSGPNEVRLERHNSNAVSFQVDKRYTNALITKTKQMKVSLHSFIHNTIVLSILDLYSKQPNIHHQTNSQRMKLRTSTPFCTRRFCNPKLPPKEIGMFASSILFEYEGSSKDMRNNFFKNCQDYMDRIRNGTIDGMRSLDLLRDVEYPNDFKQYWHGLIDSKQRGSSFILSNIGVLDFKTKGKHWDVKQIILCQPSMVGGCGFLMHVYIDGSSGNLCFSYSYQNGDFTKEEMNKFVETIKKNIKEIALREEHSLPSNL